MARYDFLSCRRQRHVRVYEDLSPAFAGLIDETTFPRAHALGFTLASATRTRNR
ncbi:MAG: hypothetical protein ABL999_15510 [Pyrinomonadaceae bacterium]